MKPFFFFALCGLAVLARATERDEKYAFPAPPGCVLKLDSYRGGVIVTEGEKPEIAIAVHMEIGADTEAQGEQMRARLRFDVKQADNAVTVFARNPSETRVRWVWRDDEQIDLTYRITVPRGCDLDVKLINGSVNVERATGRVKARLENGDFFCRQIDGSVDATVEHGNIVISRCTGDVTARTIDGLIRTGTVFGRANLKNASGNVEVLQAKGAVAATAEAGDVIVGFPRQIGGEVNLVSRGGNVRAKIDPDASCRIVATSVWGEVQNGLPLAIEAGARDRNHLTGRLHEGGPVLNLRASGGDVRLEVGETLFE